MSFEEETGDYSSIGDRTFDSKLFDNKLNIENEYETYAQIDKKVGYDNIDKLGKELKSNLLSRMNRDSQVLDVYASVDRTKKQEARRQKSLQYDDRVEKKELNDLNKTVEIYEDIAVENEDDNDEANIYETVSSGVKFDEATYGEVRDVYVDENEDEEIYNEI